MSGLPPDMKSRRREAASLASELKPEEQPEQVPGDTATASEEPPANTAGEAPISPTTESQAIHDQPPAPPATENQGQGASAQQQSADPDAELRKGATSLVPFSTQLTPATRKRLARYIAVEQLKLNAFMERTITEELDRRGAPTN